MPLRLNIYFTLFSSHLNHFNPRSPTPPEAHIKTEIAPSNSFLDNLNRNSTLASTPSTPSSPPTPEKGINRSFERGNAATATMMRREKVLTDRTNSLLRQNTTSTTEELLEWTKGICANYSNIKVEKLASPGYYHSVSMVGDQLWDKLAQRSRFLCFDPQLLSRPHPVQSAQVRRQTDPSQSIVGTIKQSRNLNHPHLPSSHDIKDNCKLAFEAAEKLGVARLIEPSDMVSICQHQNHHHNYYFLIIW